MGISVQQEYKRLKEEGQILFVTFHPSYGYENFIEGLTVDLKATKASGQIKYALKQGLFKNLCTRAFLAAVEPEKWNRLAIPDAELEWGTIYNTYKNSKIDWANAPKFVLIIDEINRGDISKIFGELITLIEADKRLGNDKTELTAILPGSGEEFGVPPNIYIIGTMNTADRSIALLDIALRRRFGFRRMDPDFELIKVQANSLTDPAKSLLLSALEKAKNINGRIEKEPGMGRDKAIGHSYLLGCKDENSIDFAWRNDILPLLEEYCCGDIPQMCRILFDSQADEQRNSLDDYRSNNLSRVINLTQFISSIK